MPLAQYNLEVMYESDGVVPWDINKAAWLLKLAKIIN